MTDDAPHYFSAWQDIFGQSSKTKKLLCRWHIDKTWRKAVKERIQDVNKKPLVYHHLLVIQNESDIIEFNKKLQRFLSWLSQEEMTDFLQYFKQNYCNRISEWATHGRQYTSVNTNMHIEAFHRLVKCVYFQQKQNRRIDCLLNVLLKLTRDKAFERLRKIEDSKLSYRQLEINKRHKRAESLSNDQIVLTSTSENVWLVNSQDKNYSISKKKGCSCPLKCSHCGVCVHMYLCSCLDNLLHSIPCKHIHLLHMQLNSEKETEQHRISSEELPTTSQTTAAASDEAFDLLDINPFGSDHDFLLDRSTDICKKILEMIPQVRDTSVLRAVNKKMQGVLSLLKMNACSRCEPAVLQPTRNYPANSNHEKQLRFYKTKRTNPWPTSRWSKPTPDEELDICSNLMSQDITVCGVCYEEDEQVSDDDGDAKYNYWTCCSKCNIWIHRGCMKKDLEGQCTACHACKE